ncbi:MAG TPA: polysaccharide deacetylase family protein [Polyangia bacterium]
MTRTSKRALRMTLGGVMLAAGWGGCEMPGPNDNRDETDRGQVQPAEVETVQQALVRSTNPPGGLAPSQVPQFVAVTFDDNFQVDGMNWAVNFFGPLKNPAGSNQAATFDNSSARTSFYHNSTYLSGMQTSWRAALNAGHEVGAHTVSHPDGIGFSTTQWNGEIHNSRSALASGLGTTIANIKGFRAPYLHYNNNAFTVLRSGNPAFTYDTSIMGCWATGEGPTNCPWPYTMEAGSADADAVATKWAGRNVVSVGAHPGIWEVPVSVVFVPPDSLAAQYGFPSGLRQRVQGLLAAANNPNFFEVSTGKLVGMDITMLLDARMSKAEALATLKYTLDQRLAGNRAPFIFVGHTHVYQSGWNANAPNVSNLTDRRAIITEFVTYALTKPAVRVRPVNDIVNWMKAPTALGGVCTPESNSAFCARLAKNCGSVSGTDNCGVARTVASCGTCTAPQTCGGGGTPNVCGGGSSSCTPTVSSYTLGKCNATAIYVGKLYRCISQAAGVNGEPTGCGTAGVYCSSIPPTDAAWGTTAWQFLQNCP